MPKITELPALDTPLTINDFFAVVNGGVTKKATSGQVAQFVLSEGNEWYFAGTWNAATNTPPLSSGSGTAGAIYRVTTAGTTSLDGYNNWQVGDFAVYNGTAWQRVRANNMPPSKNLIYISQYGNDLTGDGSYNYPYATLSGTYPKITDMTYDNQYTFILSGKINDTGNILAKFFINIKGETQGSVLNNTNPIRLDPSVQPVNGSIYIQDLAVNDIDFDASSYTAVSTAGFIQFNNVFANEVAIQGSATYSFGFFNYGSYINTCNLHNIYANSLGGNFYIVSLNVGNGPYLNSSVSLNTVGDYIANLSLTAPVSLSFTPIFLIKSFIRDSATFDGGKCVAQFDVASYKSGFVLTNGATISLISISNGLNANYIPSHYIPTDISVHGHLQGIDNALAADLTSPSKLVYVSQFGNNISGNGSLTKPYATVSFAYSQITTNDTNNIFTIVIDGVINETSLTFKPYVNLKGYNSNAYINNSGAFTLHSSWGTVTDNQTLSIEDLRINSLSFDASSFSNSLITTLKLYNSQIDGIFSTDWSASNYLYLYLYDSLVASLIAPNTAVLSYESTIFNITINGSYANTHTALYFSGGTLNNINLTAPGSVPFFPIFSIRGGTIINGTITLDGAKCELLTDVATYKAAVLLNGAVVSPININVFTVNQQYSTEDLSIGNDLTAGILQLGNAVSGQITQINSENTLINTLARITSNLNNPVLIVGDDAGTNGVIYGRSASSGAFFTNATAGDGNLRQGNTSRKLLLGVGAAISQIAILNNEVDFNVGVTFPTTGGIKTPITYYESSSFITNLTGAVSVAGYAIKVTRIENDIFYNFPLINATAIAGANIVSSTALPAKWRPISQIREVKMGARNTVGAVVIEIAITGIITIYANTTLQPFFNGLLARLDPCGINSTFN